MKKNLKGLVILAAGLVVTSSLLGCGRKKVDSPNILDIYVVNAGYRTAWVNKIKDQFLKQEWVREKYPKLKVSITVNEDQTYAENTMDAGKSANKYDLMFGLNLTKYAGSKEVVDLTDVVYNEKVPGTDIVYKTLLPQSFKDTAGYHAKGDTSPEGRYYYAPWAGGMNGIIYNENFFEDYSLGDIPRTTDELVAVATDFNTKTRKYPFIQGSDEAYFNYLFEIFWGQYQGVEGYYDFWNGVDDGALSKDIFKQKGRLEALKVFKALLNEGKFINPTSFNQNFMTNQYYFISGASLFNVNGDWFVSEMKQLRKELVEQDPSKNYTFKMMKTPIVSSIIETEECESIADDAELSALIKAIDNESTALSGEGYDVTQDAYDKIKAARGVVHNIGNGHTAIIPSYCLAKDAAIDFVRFMATEDAQNAYIEATDGASLPFIYDVQTKNPELYSKIDPLHQERISYLNSDFMEPYALPNYWAFPLSRYGGVEAFKPQIVDANKQNKDYFINFSYPTYEHAGGRSYQMAPQKYYDDTIAYYTDARWDDAIRRAGLK